jgi:hypothetical protein
MLVESTPAAAKGLGRELIELNKLSEVPERLTSE